MKKVSLNFHFIDFKAAFDTVWRKALWKMLKSIGVCSKIVNIVEYMYNQTECSILIDGQLKDWFHVEVGVRQGCILSPTLFNIFLEFVMDELSCLQSSLKLNPTLSTDIRYADDTSLIAFTFEKLQISTTELHKACKKWGLKVNQTKCKVLTSETRNITIDGNSVENVDNFVFLGSVVPDTADDVKRRIALASSAFGRLKEKIWRNRSIPLKIKTRLYYALIVPIAIYACETWTLRKAESQSLLVFENNCLRSMLGKTLLDRVKIVTLRRKVGVERNIIEIIKKRRLSWFGHVARRGEESYVYRAFKDEFPGRRPRGRPPKRWIDQLRDDTNLPPLTLERKAKDRDLWKKFVQKKCAKIPLGLSN